MTTAELENEGYISLRDAAEIAGYTPDYLGQLIRKGKLPGRQVYSNVAWMTTKEAVLEYVEREGRRGKREEEKIDTPPVSPADRFAEFLLSPRGIAASRIVLIALATLFAYALLGMIAISAVAFDRSIAKSAMTDANVVYSPSLLHE